MTFAQDWLTVLGAMFGLAVVGGWALVPLRERGVQVVYLAPALGLMVLVFGVSSLYAIARFSLGLCASVTAASGALVTVAAVWHVRRGVQPRALVVPILLGIGLTTILTLMTDETTLRLGSPGLLYMDGTDHLGYAQMADWLRVHTVVDMPRSDPAKPYESFLELLFRVDTRFGSFEWLGVLTLLTGRAGAFVYAIGCAIVLSAGILALAGLFARTRWMALCLASGLLMSHWFDYAMTGYFGKAIGFPASLLAAGLFVTTRGSTRYAELAVLLLATAAASIMYSGLVTALLVITVGLPFVVYDALRAHRQESELLALLKDRAIVLGLVAGVATLTTGFASRPGEMRFPDYNLAWTYIGPRLFDLESQGVALTKLDQTQLSVLTGLIVAVLLVGLVIAAWRGLAVAVALIGGPVILLAASLALDARAVAFQVLGITYPLALCGLAVVIETRSPPFGSGSGRMNASRWLAAACLAVLWLAHTPRFLGALDRYAVASPPEAARYSQAEMDAIASLIGTSIVEVDIAEPHSAIMALVDFGRRGLSAQWTPRAWNTILGYRDWSPPHYATTAALCLSSQRSDERGALYASPRYQLLAGACPESPSP